MVIEFSEHAIDQLSRRGILKRQVVEVVNKPEEIIESYKERRLRRKRLGGKILEVVTVTENEKVIVITAYFLKEEKNEN